MQRTPLIAAVGLIAAATFAIFSAARIELRPLELVLPLFALLAVFLSFAAILEKLSAGGLQYFEIGVVFGAILFLYGAYPLTSFLLSGQTFTDLGDVRLYAAQPASEDIARIGWYYVLFSFCFGIAYLAARGRASRHHIELRAAGVESIVITVLLIVLSHIFFQSIAFLWGDVVSDYSSQYLAYRHMPLLVRQIANHLDGIVLTLNLLLLTALMTHWRRARWWVMAWLGVEAMIAVMSPGSRTRLFLLLLGFIINFHYLVKPLTLRAIMSSGLIGLILFLVLGALRTFRMLDDPQAQQVFLLGGTEFESLFANAFDLERRKNEGLTDEIVPLIYIADLMRLIPQQLLPWTKIDLADWYVQTFYPEYSRTGGGLAFGVIPESLLGLGVPDLIWRGIAVGLLLAGAQRAFAQRGETFLRFALYLWLLLLSYQIIRNTTFALVPLFFYQFLPAAVAVVFLSKLLRYLMRQNLLR